MSEKTISGWLVVDWKTGSHRTRKSKPSHSELGTNELLAELKVDVTVPEVEVPTLAVEIDVPEPQVYAATLEAIEDEDLPDWSDGVTEAVETHAALFEDADSPRAWENAVDTVAMRVLQQATGRPDPERVREYVDQLARETNEVDA